VRMGRRNLPHAERESPPEAIFQRGFAFADWGTRYAPKAANISDRYSPRLAKGSSSEVEFIPVALGAPVRAEGR